MTDDDKRLFEIPIAVDDPSFRLHPSLIEALRQRMTAEPRMPHFLAAGPFGEGVHAIRVELGVGCGSGITFSLVPTERDELHQVIGMLAIPHAEGGSGKILLRDVVIRGRSMIFCPVDLCMFTSRGPARIDLGAFGTFAPIELTFEHAGTDPAACDVFLLVQRHRMPDPGCTGSIG